MSAAGAILSIDVACDKCSRKRGAEPIDVFLEMAPKVDTVEPFFLCVKCYLAEHKKFDSAPPRVLEAPPVKAEVAPPSAKRAKRKVSQ